MTDLDRIRVFRALGDPTRLALLIKLCEEECGCAVSEAAECCTVDMSVVSRHLATLRDAGIVEAERQGREVRYKVNYGAVVATLRSMADAIEKCGPGDETTCCEQQSEEKKNHE